ncbi:MAG: GHKL domain-containing protein [bacterium]|nr:GHKL domain-containing protein [bacterium]
MLFDRMIQKRVAAFEEEIMQKYYAEVENMYNRMRGWRHDYRHHIQTMKVYAAGGQMEAIREYLDMLDDDLTNVETAVRTGNRMVDAILNSKLSLAAQRQIRVTAEAKIPVALSTPAPELCVIVGNLLDNAIDACMELEPSRRLIRIYMEMKGNYLYLAVTNTAGGAKKKSFRSGKGEGHGFGIPRVDEVVKRHDGYVTRASEEEAFSTEILLPQ